MNKVTTFYNKVLSDEKSKKEYFGIAGDTELEKLSAEQISKLGELAKKIGIEISEEEFHEYVSGGELDDDDLDAVAGGKGETHYKDVVIYHCDVGGQAGADDGNFGDGAERVDHAEKHYNPATGVWEE